MTLIRQELSPSFQQGANKASNHRCSTLRALLLGCLSLWMAVTALPLAAQTPEAGFHSGAGQFVLNRETDSETVEDVVIDSQGRILLATRFVNGNDEWPAILRLNSDGSTDLSFGFLGIWTEAAVPATPNRSIRLTVDAQDRPLIGYTYSFDQNGTLNHDWWIRQVTENGQSDFGKVAAFDLGLAGGHVDDRLADLLILPDNRLVAVGAAQFSEQDYDFAVAVWTPTASSYILDTGFDGDGRATTHFDRGGSKADLPARVHFDGSHFVVVGTALTDTGSEIAALRMHAATGALDSNFSGDGKETYVHPSSGGQTFDTNSGADVISVGGGSYVVAGSSADSVQHAVVFKILASGAVDTSWGSSGWNRVGIAARGESMPTDPSDFAQVRQDSLGGIVAAGGVRSHGRSSGIVARFDASGSPDTPFTSGIYAGLATYNFEPFGQTSMTYLAAFELDVTGTRAIVGGYRLGDNSGVVRQDFDLFAASIRVVGQIFADGFENGSTVQWSSATP